MLDYGIFYGYNNTECEIVFFYKERNIMGKSFRIVLSFILVLILSLTTGCYRHNTVPSDLVRVEEEVSDFKVAQGYKLVFSYEEEDSEELQEKITECLDIRFDGVRCKLYDIYFEDGKLCVNVGHKYDPEKMKELITKTGQVIFYDRDGVPLMNNDQIKHASGEYGNISAGKPVYYVNMAFTDEGIEMFHDISVRYSQRTSYDAKVIRVFLDEETIYAALMTNELHATSVYISNEFDEWTAYSYGAIINSGILPCDLTFESMEEFDNTTEDIDTSDGTGTTL